MDKIDNMEKSDDEVAYEALLEARERFKEVLTGYNIDAAYFDTRFTTWVIDDSLTTRLRRIEIEEEVKNE